MVAGYLTAVVLGIVDFSPLAQAQLFTIPNFHLTKFDLQAVITMVPVLLVITAEHIGHQIVTGNVIGGITFLLYGMIGTSGLRILVDKQVDYSKNRNLILTSVVFVAGLSGLTLKMGAISITGMTLAAVTAMVLSLAFYALDKAKLMND